MYQTISQGPFSSIIFNPNTSDRQSHAQIEITVYLNLSKIERNDQPNTRKITNFTDYNHKEEVQKIKS